MPGGPGRVYGPLFLPNSQAVPKLPLFSNAHHVFGGVYANDFCWAFGGTTHGLSSFFGAPRRVVMVTDVQYRRAGRERLGEVCAYSLFPGPLVWGFCFLIVRGNFAVHAHDSDSQSRLLLLAEVFVHLDLALALGTCSVKFSSALLPLPLRRYYPSMLLTGILLHRRPDPSPHTTKPRPGGCHGPPRFWFVLGF